MAAASSAPFFGMREEDPNQMIIKQQQQQSSSTTPPSLTTAPAQTSAPPKKKRNLPGNPNPDAEVIALSPKTLMATNRFICEVCNKGFQREQNLQLHRRGHNLPWKLKQKSTKEVRRRVYLCPEPTCVHHDPSRALGDLTGIKKHFCRKHGEKKWKCDKCSKRYAVQSDWKAHSKTCGTREYRCDCGTLFSRRDSFITHRAFCDALAQESARLPASLTTLGSHLYGGNMGLGLSQVNSQISSLHDQSHPSADLLRLGASAGGSHFDHHHHHHLLSPSNPSSFRPPSSAFYLGTGSSNQDYNNNNNDQDSTQSHHSLLHTKTFSGLMQLPDLQTNANPSSSSAAAANLFNLGFFSNGSSASSINNLSDQFNNGTGNNNNNNTNNEAQAALFSTNLMNDHQLYGHESVGLPQMSATALLQKAAQMGATTSSGGAGSSLLRGFGSSSSTSNSKPTTNFRSQMENESHLHDLMNSLANGNAGIFGGGQEQGNGFGGFGSGIGSMEEAKFQRSIGGSDGMTRDFLGVGSMVRGMGGGGGMSQREQQQHQGIDIGSMEPELKSTSAARSFPGGSLQ